MDFPGVSVVKNLPANAGDAGSIPGLGRSPGGGNGKPLQNSCLENPMDKSLVGCNPWGHKQSDTTKATWHSQSYVVNPENFSLHLF